MMGYVFLHSVIIEKKNLVWILLCLTKGVFLGVEYENVRWSGVHQSHVSGSVAVSFAAAFH
jgi:hypothetical protein